MSFPLYPNTTAGLAAIGPVQAMSDRNEAQTYMANGGQMFASGGIASLAEGGSTAASKYKFDPVTQKYILEGDAQSEAEAELELLKKKRAMESSGSSTKAEPTAWDNMTNAQKAAYYAANPTMAKITQMGQKALGLTGIGRLAEFFNPQGFGEAQAIAKGFDPSQTSFGRGAGSIFGIFGSGMEATPKEGADVYGYGYKDFNTGALPVDPDAPSTFNPVPSSGYGDINYSSPSADPSSYSSPTAESLGYTGETYAHGGIAALAGGGQSHLGDYSDGGRLLRGPGDGVSDSIPASIGGKRPARLADGEFVVPARIVSELGNGSTEAGARKLYAMMDRIQKARSKTVGKDRVAVNSRAEKNLPA